MKNFRILTVSLLFVLLLLPLFVNSAWAEEENIYTDGQGLTYELSPDGTHYIVKGLKEGNTPSEVTILEEIDGIPVTVIGEYAFPENKFLEKVFMPNTITVIRENGFRACYNMTEVKIPDSVTYIGEGAFSFCSSLKEIHIPKSVTYIGPYAFGWYTFPESITVEEGNGVYFSEGNCLIEINTKTLIRGCENSVIPNNGTVEIIGNCAFYSNDIAEITLPDGLKRIEGAAFYDCNNLKNIVLPETLEYIDSEAFMECDGLTEVTVPCSTGDRAFACCDNIEKLTFRNDLNNDNGINIRIGAAAFSDLPKLTQLDLGEDDVCWIDSAAFSGCDTLTEIIIPSGVRQFMERAFYDCDGLTSIVIPASVTNIAESAFSGCDNLVRIYCEASSKPEDWEENWDEGCAALVKWNYNGTVQEIPIYEDEQGIIYRLAYDGDYYVVIGCTDPEVTAIDIQIEVCGYPVTIIRSNAFYQEGVEYKLETVYIPDSVTEIGENAFRQCEFLSEIDLPESLEYIAPYAFAGCNGLTEISINCPVDYYAFENCENLEQIVFGGRNVTIGMGAFSECWKLKTVDMSDAVTVISQNAFRNCYELEAINISSSLKEIGSEAFWGCRKITELYLPPTIEHLEEHALAGCINLTDLYLESGTAMYGWGQDWNGGLGLKYHWVNENGEAAEPVKSDSEEDAVSDILNNSEKPTPDNNGIWIVGIAAAIIIAIAAAVILKRKNK